MKFLPIIELETEKDAKTLKAEYKAARQFGKVALGSENFFYKDKFKVRYIPFANIYRAFRRVQCVNMKMCCAGGQLQLQNIVLCSKKNDELCMVDLPDERAALALFEEIEKNHPEIKIGMKK